MQKVLVSSCLLGNKTRFDGNHFKADSEILQRWIDEGRVVAVCPEADGGLPIPRPPSEAVNGDSHAIISGEGKVIDINGKDVTAEFMAGAKIALQLCREHDITTAVLADPSPMCGSRFTFDGSFVDSMIPGVGVATAYLRENEITVFSQNEFVEADERLMGG